MDPFAEGVLIIATGIDTKKLQQISVAAKSYEAELFLGSETDTLDCEGKVIRTVPVRSITEDQIQNVLKSFEGPQEQTPPMYSAKKVNGIRLYKLARKKITIPRKPVNITIYSLNLDDFDGTSIRFTVSCSKGTYIRVLGLDIAKKLGTAGHLKQLRRTRVGDYTLKDSMTIEDFEHSWSSTAI